MPYSRTTSVLRLAGLMLAGSTISLTAQVPGTIERFTDQVVSQTWEVYDYQDGRTRPPLWVDGADPHVDYAPTGDAAIWFLAGTSASGGKLTGNLSQGIDGLAVAVRIDDPGDFEWLDILIASVIDGKYYQSDPLFPEDIPGSGWLTVTTPFDAPWYYYNGIEFEQVDLSQGALNQVGEVGVRIMGGSGVSGTIGCDDFRLVPTLVQPQLTQSPWGLPEFEFELLPGHVYDVETSDTLEAWQPVPGYTNLTGSGVMAVPLGTDPGASSSRVSAGPHYTE